MIELRHLRYFRAVAEEQNFHRAAERIPVDPSALSRAVRELEEHVPVPAVPFQINLRVRPMRIDGGADPCGGYLHRRATCRRHTGR